MRILMTLAAAISLSAPAFAAITVGATVKDTAGGVVGTVASVAAGNVVVDTGSNKVTIPETSFATTPDGPLLAMTKSQLDAAAEQALAAQKQQLAAAIQPGATVRGTQGGIIGTIASLDGDFVLVKGEAGEARIPASGLALKADGLHFGMTVAEFAEAAKATPAAADNPTP
ncbi:preprotein translocase subunit YajC [Sandarakinorhabdus rubra]|uniref:preprotein translocase subunit YajC n=1 Tax=Sandarakinorhabdus rubra TaxID=2672568 RepID=UPI0013D9FCC7|nr:preprotein translocase subunit YajC [Sandarakinorhabdus rubra]